MIVGRSMHERWLSNAYVVGDVPGGTAVFVDSGAPLEPLLELVARERLTPTHLLRTHAHPDHVEHEVELCDRFGIPSSPGISSRGAWSSGRSRCRATPTTASRSSSDDGVCFSGDVLFKDAVGGGPADVVQRSVMDGLMTLPADTRVLPGHTEETTIGREWESNPFVVYWRGAVPSLGERVSVAGDEAELVVWSPDYDGNGKALVRFADGREAIVGGSRVERD